MILEYFQEMRRRSTGKRSAKYGWNSTLLAPHKVGLKGTTRSLDQEGRKAMARAFEKITRSNMRSLKRGKKLAEHGIAFERSATGDGVFSVNFMVDRQRIHRVIGRESEGVVRGHAEQFIQKARSEAREGRLSLPSGRKTHLGFSEAATKYEVRLTETNGKNMSVKRRHFKRCLTPFFGSQRLDCISSFTVERYKRRRIDAGASKGTINLELATISHLMSCAME